MNTQRIAGRNGLFGHGVAIACAAAALGLRWALDPWLGERLPLVTLFGGVALVAWSAGIAPAIASALIGYAGCLLWFVREPGVAAHDVIGLVAYLVSCAIIIGVTERMRRAEAGASLGREVLRTTLASLGDAVLCTDERGRVDYMNAVAEVLTGWTLADATGRPVGEVLRLVDVRTREPIQDPSSVALREGIVVLLDRPVLLLARDGGERTIEDSAAPIRGESGAIRGSVVTFRDVSERARADDVLRRNERELADAFDNANVGLHWIDADGVVVRANRSQLELLGYPSEGFVGRPIGEFHDDPAAAAEILARLKAGETIERFATRLRARDGSLRDVLLNCSSHREGDRFVLGRCFALDVTELKRAEEARAELGAIVTTSDDAIVSKSLEGVIRSWNAGAQRLFGYTADEAVGQSITLIVPPERLDEERSNLERLRLGERIEHFETVRVAKDGRRIDVSLAVSPVRDASGRLIGAAKVARDIRALRRGEAAQAQLAAIVTTSDDAIVGKTLDGTVTSWNAGAERLFGYAASEVIGKPITSIIAPELVPEERRILERLRRGERIEHFETVRVAKDGRRIDVSLALSPIRDGVGRLIGAASVARDITEAKRARGELARLANEMRLVTDAIPALIAYIDAHERYRFNNRAYSDWFGVPTEALKGRHISKVVGEAAYQRIRPRLEQALAGQLVQYEEELPYDKGGSRHISAQYVPDILPDGSVAGCFVLVTDIGNVRRAEAAQRRLVALAEASGEFIALCDVDLRPTYVNAAGLRMLGLASVEEAQRAVLLDFLHPDERADFRDPFLARVELQGRGEIETRLRRCGGDETIWVLCSVAAMSDERGRSTGFGVVALDITDRKRAEQELQDEARRKDEFLATLAHELRSPLAPLGNMLEVLRRADGDPARRREAREMMERQLAHLVRLADDLLDLSRITRGRLELRRERVELADVLGRAQEIASPLVEASMHRLDVAIEAGSIPLEGDPVRLAQVFGNLLHNACKYTPPGGRIALAARREGDSALVSVSDDGVGISADLLERIFEMFTQGPGGLGRRYGGLGIGLTLVRQLVELHGGSVEAASPGPGRGSTFFVRLPLAREGGALRPSAARLFAPGPPRRVLVVDDSIDSAESLSLLLQLHGHRTRVAHDGPSALALAEGFRPEAALLDLGLPGMDGLELCRRLRETPWGRAALVVALTGWGQEEDRRRSKAAGIDAHLVKPVDAATLLDLLSSISERPPEQDGAG